MVYHCRALGTGREIIGRATFGPFMVRVENTEFMSRHDGWRVCPIVHLECSFRDCQIWREGLTELNPRPKRPVVPPSSFFIESPSRDIFSKSLSVNTALLNTSKDGPWYFCRAGSISALEGWVSSSRMNLWSQISDYCLSKINISYHFSCTSVICVLQQFAEDCAAGFVPITYILQRDCEQLNLCVLLYWLRDNRSHVCCAWYGTELRALPRGRGLLC